MCVKVLYVKFLYVKLCVYECVFVCVCEVMVCERWYVTQLCVYECVFVCVKLWYVRDGM